MKRFLLTCTAAIMLQLVAGAQGFRINDGGYFNLQGVDAMAFNDYYPEGH